MATEKKKVLIVEDERDTREALQAALEGEGLEVVTASDGQKGLAAARSHEPDLILMDIVMPHLGGLEMLKEIRKDEWGKNVEVIVMTVLENMEHVADAVEEGGEYLVKTDMSLQDVVTRVKARLGLQ